MTEEYRKAKFIEMISGRHILFIGTILAVVVSAIFFGIGYVRGMDAILYQIIGAIGIVIGTAGIVYMEESLDPDTEGLSTFDVVVITIVSVLVIVMLVLQFLGVTLLLE